MEAHAADAVLSGAGTARPRARCRSWSWDGREIGVLRMVRDISDGQYPTGMLALIDTSAAICDVVLVDAWECARAHWRKTIRRWLRKVWELGQLSGGINRIVRLVVRGVETSFSNS